MDDKLTQDLQAWLSAPPESRDVRRGAEMLLRLSRNRILYQNILRSPDKLAPKLEYELRKHLRIRLDGLTRREVMLMDREVMPQAKKTIEAGCPLPAAPVMEADADQPAPAFTGRRADHDALPPHIRALYDENGDLWFRIKQTYNTLLSMEHLEPCDRYEHLRILKDLDARYRENWQRYDDFDPTAPASPQPLPRREGLSAAPDTLPTGEGRGGASAVSAARKFLSTNRKKLADATDGAERARLVAAMQERVDLVLAAGESFKPDYRAQLEAIGLTFGSNP